VHAVRGILPNVLAREIVSCLVARCWLLSFLLTLFREKRLIFFHVVQRSGSKFLRIIVLIDAGGSALGSARPAQRSTCWFLQVAATSTVSGRMNSRTLAVRRIIILDFVGSQNGCGVFMVLVVYSRIFVTIRAVLWVLRIVNVHSMFTIGANDLRLK